MTPHFPFFGGAVKVTPHSRRLMDGSKHTHVWKSPALSREAHTLLFGSHCPGFCAEENLALLTYSLIFSLVKPQPQHAMFIVVYHNKLS
jgi:hypothetical protein